MTASRVVVVGGGFGGLAAAARLAKLGHDVTLLERSDHLGGVLARVSQDGFSWDAGPTYTLLPAVVRDLFRKSGRPLERELDLVPLDLLREHRFEDGSRLRLPHGRAGQLAAVDELGPGLGQQWVDHVASYAEDWDVLRRGYLENPWRPDDLPREVAARLDSRATLQQRLRRTFRDDRLRQVAAHPLLAEGHDLREVPAWLGMGAYVEQRFGAWTVAGGLARLGEVLAARLVTRGVTTATSTAVSDLVVRDGRVVGVRTSGGDLDADVVVCAFDPRRLPALAPYVRRTTPAPLPALVHLGLTEDVDLPHELVLHGDPTLVVRRNGPRALTLHVRGRTAEDPLAVLARRGTDVRPAVATRVDRSPASLEQAWGGSPYGVAWAGRRTVRRRLGPRSPVAGVYVAGAHATPGAGLHLVGLSAALVAAEVGPADRR